jgi:Heparinase II/III-like protein/Heparinase II/III N-terminus
MGSLLLPMRMSIYQFRREVFHNRKRNARAAIHSDAQKNSAPAFSAHVYPVFCDPAAGGGAAGTACPAFDLDSVFAESDAQLRGVYRLAGARTCKINPDSIESRDDAEDVHAYHRLYWVRRFALAACAGSVAARVALVRELPKWIKERAEKSAIAGWPYTRAERIANLTETLFWIARSNRDDLAQLIVPIKLQIWRDAARLASNVEFGLGLHNHLLNDARGLFLASAAVGPGCAQSTQWRDQAFAIWDEYFPQLVLDDGSFSEQSSHYHLLLTRTALEYWLASRSTGHTMPAGFEERIHRMFDLANEFLRADGSLPRFGDNSPDGTVSDLWGLLAAAFHFGLLAQPPRHRLITPLTFYYCGANPELPTSLERAARRVFPNGGFTILRSSALDAELIVHGDCGGSAGTHGDAGRGSYELWWNGQVLVREPGSFYSSSDPVSLLYHSAEAQNVTSLDGLSPMIAKEDGRFIAPWYKQNGGEWETTSDGGVRFRCHAFSRLHPGITLTRHWRFDSPESLAFEESIDGARRVNFESRIFLGDAPWQPVHDGVGTADKSGAATAAPLRKMLCVQPDGSFVEMIITVPKSVSIELRDSAFLPEYGVEKKGRTLLLTGFQQLPFSWMVQWKLRKAT